MKFTNKTIVVVSQQDWGKMFISKHHYAVELAKKGNKVYFLNSPDRSGVLKAGEVIIEDTGYDNLYVIKHSFFYPYIIKFKAKWLHNFLLRFHLKKVVDCIGSQPDIIWSFDISGTIPLQSFPGDSYKIFMPVDEPGMSVTEAASAAKGARAMFSVTTEILDMYSGNPAPKLFTNHGVLEKFIGDGVSDSALSIANVGLSGNFMRPDLDWDTHFKIIEEHPEVVFNFFGPFEKKDSNLSGGVSEATRYKEQLMRYDNVRLYGSVDPDTLSVNLKKMDCFLICYDIEKDQCHGTNYHKVLEYIATGKVVVANNITTYKNEPDLVAMSPERNNNNSLPALFKDVVAQPGYYNSVEKQQKRIKYARAHTYSENLNKIEAFINSIG